jgi:hypothetical protein
MTQSVNQRTKFQTLGSFSAVKLKKCGFQNPLIQKIAAAKGRANLTLKKKQAFFMRLSTPIQEHFNKTQKWVYEKEGRFLLKMVCVNSCLSLACLLIQLESTGYAVGGVNTLKTTKTNGLSKVIKGIRPSYDGWSFLK